MTLQEDVEREHDDYVAYQRKKLESSLKDAVGQAGSALYFVRHLSSDQVYDIEYAESSGDVERMIQQAQDLLSGALALAKARHA